MTSFLGHHTFRTHLSSSNFLHTPKPKPFKSTLVCASVPAARDRVIDFGKYKGRMLGTLPSSYLKWVSNNLRARDFEDWAKLADEVLEDPVYNDRVEWELAEKHLSGDVLAANSMSRGAVAELLEISQRFGWDNEDKDGWARVDFRLLGTSKGGRIPRAKEGRREKTAAVDNGKERGERSPGRDGGGRERRERSKMRRGLPEVKDRFNVEVGGVDNERPGKRGVVVSGDDQTPKVYSPFPGRETLFRKALQRGPLPPR